MKLEAEDIKWVNRVIRRFTAKDIENYCDTTRRIFKNKKKYNRKEKYNKKLWQ